MQTFNRGLHIADFWRYTVKFYPVQPYIWYTLLALHTTSCGFLPLYTRKAPLRVCLQKTGQNSTVVLCDCRKEQEQKT